MKPHPFNIVTTALAVALLAYAFTGKARPAELPTSAANPAMIAPVLNSMVLENTFLEAVATPTDKRSFVTPKILGSSALALPHMLMGGMAAAATPGARLRACFQHPARPTCLKTRKADYLGSLEGIQTMNESFTPAQAAPTLASTHEAALIELHCAAHNAAVLAKLYTSRKQYPQAARKTRQHLSALRQLAKLEGGAV